MPGKSAEINDWNTSATNPIHYFIVYWRDYIPIAVGQLYRVNSRNIDKVLLHAQIGGFQHGEKVICSRY